MTQDRPVAADAPFAETLSRFSRHLAERTRTTDNTDPGTAARARQAALHEHDRARRQRLLVVGGLAGAALAGVAASLGLALLAPSREPALQAAASAQATAPTPFPTPAPLPAPVTAEPAIRGEVPMPTPGVAPVSRTADLAPLDRAEIRDVQTRLRGFGFDPGPLDGNPGPRTLAAAQRYQESRNQPPSTEIDRALLEQLRLDPAPVVVAPLQVAQRGGRGTPPPTRARPANPFDQLGRWLDSLVR